MMICPLLSGIKQCLIARGCSKDFHAISALQEDMSRAKFTAQQLGDFIQRLQASKKLANRIYKTGTTTIVLDQGARHQPPVDQLHGLVPRRDQRMAEHVIPLEGVEHRSGAASRDGFV